MNSLRKGMLQKYWRNRKFVPTIFSNLFVHKIINADASVTLHPYGRKYSHCLSQKAPLHRGFLSKVAVKVKRNIAMDESITFRRACPEDHEQINQLSKGLYDGTDCFSSMFLDLVKSPIWHIYVAVDKKNSQLVACVTGLLTDGGKVLFLRNARVRSTYQGNKLFTRIASFALNDVKLLRNTIVYERYMLTAETLAKHPNLISNGNVLSQFEIASFLVDCQLAKATLSNNDVSDEGLLQLSLKQVQECPSCKSHLGSLLPKGLIVIEGDCFNLLEISKEEKNYLEARQLGFLVSSGCHTSESSEITPNQSFTLSAIYWKPVKFTDNTWGTVLSIYGSQSDQIIRHINYVMRMQLKFMETQNFMQIKVAYFRDNTNEEAKLRTLIQDWTDGLRSNFQQCTHNVNITLVDSLFLQLHKEMVRGSIGLN